MARFPTTRFLCLLAACLVLAASAGRSAASSTKQPNLLFIFADDIGYEALGCYGGLDFETPRLDRMAAEGVRFSRAHTSPVCTPSRVSMHTGLYVTRHGHTGVLPVHNGTVRKVDFQQFPTFAQLLRKEGYLTSTTGKWQLATLEVWPDHIRESGFDSWCVWQIWKDGAKTLRHWDATFNEDGIVRDDIADRFGPAVLADYVVEQMTEARDANQPFLIVHNELLPHYPIIDTPEDRERGRKASLGNMIHYLDLLVGRLLDEVESLGLRESTYVFFMGDNGTLETDFRNPRTGQPGEGPHTRHTTAGLVNGGKHQLNDAGSHVPLLAWGPKAIPAGTVCDDLVDVVDLFPTFCELASTDIPESLAIDGRSIAPQVHGKPGVHRAWVHHALTWNEKKQSGGPNLFDGSWRLTRKGNELIDARKLPVEIPASDEDPASAEARERLRSILKQITKGGPRPPLPFPHSSLP